MTTNDLLEYEIYPKLNRAEALPELEPQDKGKTFLLKCPACDKRDAFIYKDGYAIKCNRVNNCGYSSSLWDYIKERDSLTQAETLKKLARIAGVTLPERGEINTEEIERRNKKASVLDEVLERSQEALKKSTEAIEYLKTRGFTLEEALSLGIGFYSDKASITNNVSIGGFNGLKSDKWEKRIIGLWKDASGQAMTLWGRDITGEAEQKYYYLYGEKKDRPYGLDRAYGKEIIAVEGILDALNLMKNGFSGVIATGGSTLTGDQIKALKNARKTAITLNLDNDEGGYKGIETAIDKLEAEGIKSYVVEPSLMGVKDPDEYIRKNDKEAYKDLLNKAQRGVEWKIERIYKRNGTKEAKARDTVLNESIELLNAIKDPIIYDYGIKKTASVLDMPLETIAKIALNATEQAERERIKKDYASLLHSAPDMEIDEVISGLKDIQARTGRVTLSPLSDFIAEKKEKDEARTGELLGYKLKKFKTICKRIDGIQRGFYIIGGETNTGKTAFLANLFLDMLQSNEDLSGIYFSLDDNKETIINRFISGMTGIEINRTQRPADLSPIEKGRRDTAYREITALSEGRLFLEDITKIDNIRTLENYIKTVLRSNDKVFIAIDGLYNLDIGTDKGGIREENIERANRLKALVETFNIPVLCSGELRKKEKKESENKPPTVNDLMETGKFAYNADLVLLVYPEDRDALEGEADEITLNCRYAKNKLSWYRGTDPLKFKRKTSTLEELERREYKKDGSEYTP